MKGISKSTAQPRGTQKKYTRRQISVGRGIAAEGKMKTVMIEREMKSGGVR